VVRLVNLGGAHPRLIVQAGAFGEHLFTTARHEDGEVSVNSRFLGVDLAPGASIRLELGTKRFVNAPSYAFPWHGGRVPAE
jgi:hypothetical protein